MKKLMVVVLLVTMTSYGQQSKEVDIVKYKEVYLDNNLVHLMSNDSLYNGLIQNRRKNGHLVQEELVENGIVIYLNLYFNRLDMVPATRMEYNKRDPGVPSKMFSYNQDKTIREVIWFDEVGNKKLVEEFEDEKLIYSCEYNGRKKNGKEFCYSRNGSPITVLYKNGKKIKNKN